MQPSLSHLENIDARFLEPDASLVVMCESTVRSEEHTSELQSQR